MFSIRLISLAQLVEYWFRDQKGPGSIPGWSLVNISLAVSQASNFTEATKVLPWCPQISINIMAFLTICGAFEYISYGLSPPQIKQIEACSVIIDVMVQ